MGRAGFKGPWSRHLLHIPISFPAVQKSIAQSFLFGSSVFWFGSWWVPGALGRVPEVPETDGWTWGPPGGLWSSRGRRQKVENPYFLLGPLNRPIEGSGIGPAWVQRDVHRCSVDDLEGHVVWVVLVEERRSFWEEGGRSGGRQPPRERGSEGATTSGPSDSKSLPCSDSGLGGRSGAFFPDDPTARCSHNIPRSSAALELPEEDFTGIGPVAGCT